LTLENLAGLVREWLGWMGEGYEFWFEDRIDIGSSNGPQMKTISPVCNEKEWTTYVRVGMKLEIHGIELIVRMVGRNDGGDESILGRQRCQKRLMSRTYGVVLTQPSQESHDDTDVDEEPSFISSNEIVLNVKPVLESVGVSDDIADMGIISSVDPQPIATAVTITGDAPSSDDTGMISSVDPHPIATTITITGDAPFIVPEFIAEYNASFGDERADDSADDCPVSELSNMDKVLL
jgi:hypothetical protein